MSEDYYRGIRYCVTEPRQGRWKWEIHPPECVKGWAKASGEVDGQRDDAVAAAKRHIERQDCGLDRLVD